MTFLGAFFLLLAVVLIAAHIYFLGMLFVYIIRWMFFGYAVIYFFRSIISVYKKHKGEPLDEDHEPSTVILTFIVLALIYYFPCRWLTGWYMNLFSGV